MADIFREVDEEIRRERLNAALRRFGPLALAAAVVALLIAGGIFWWQSYQNRGRGQDATQFIHAQALLDAGKPKDAAEAFAKVAESAGGGYPTLARFMQAEALLQTGDRSGAVAAYDALAKSSDDPLFKQLAQWKAADLLIGAAPREELERRLAPLMDEHSPFRYSARESRAAAALQANDRDTAIAMLQQLTDDINAPPGLRKRAEETLTALGAPPRVTAIQAPAPASGTPE